MPNLLCGPWLTLNDCWLSEWVIELGVEVGFEHETWTISFQQCDQVKKFLVKSRKTVWVWGVSWGREGPSKTGLIISLDLGSHLNFNNSSFFGRSFPLKKLLVLNVCHLCQWTFQDCRIPRQHDITDSVEARVRDAGFTSSYVTYTSRPRAGNGPNLRLSTSAKWNKEHLFCLPFRIIMRAKCNHT